MIRAARDGEQTGSAEQKFGEAHAFGGEPVEVGRVQFGAVGAQVAIAEIVAENEDDVGWFCGGAECLRCYRGGGGSDKLTSSHASIMTYGK